MGSSQTQLSEDGCWWWDGQQWHPALSEDGRWRWTGSEWVPTNVPAQAEASPSRRQTGWLHGKGATGPLLIGVGVVATVVVFAFSLTQSDPVNAFVKYEGVIAIGLMAGTGTVSGRRWAVFLLGLLVVALVVAAIGYLLFG